MPIYRSVTELIGRTPLLELCNYERAHGLQATVLAKLECMNPAGSAKDRVAARMIAEAEARGYGKLPVIIAKTQYSLSDDAKLLSRPQGFTVHVRDIIVKGGAEFVVAVAGNIMLMPGLGKVPAAEHIGVDESGEIVGLS